MNAVGNPRVEDHWAVQQTYPLWKELPTDITCNQVLTLLNPLDHSRCSVVCKQWNRFLTSDDVWQPLLRNHFPSMTPGFFKSFQVYQCFYSNFQKGVCSMKTLLGHNGGVNSLVLKDTTLFSGSSDRTIKIWDLRTNTCTATLKGHMAGVACLALKDATLFSGSWDETIKIWDLATNTCTATLKGHTRGVNSLVLKDATLFSGSEDKTIKIWDLESNACTATLKGHTRELDSLALRDATLFSGSSDNMIKIWDLGNNTCTATLEGHMCEASSLVLKEATLFSSSRDKTIKIWDLRDNTCTATLKGYSWVSSLALKDATLFSGSSDSSDNMIKIWDLESNACTATLKGHTNGVRSLALKDTTLFSGSWDNTIKIWDFAASHVEVFTEIASALEGQDPMEADFAIDRFSKMPKAAKNKTFGELHKIIKPNLKRDYWGCAEDAFYEKKGQRATNAQRAEAIKNYLIRRNEQKI
jgi:WD40 repeat protein